ncbi:MAG: rhomboid family intramembrane serine protease [Caldilineaceae bacterium]
MTQEINVPVDNSVSNVGNDETVAFLQQLFQRTPTIFITQLLIGLNILIWVLMVFSGAGIMGEDLVVFVHWGANYAPFTTNGEWWRLFTSIFLHFGIIHLGFNMFALYQIGPILERIYGNLGYLLIYLAAAITGGLASLLFYTPPIVSAGASGAIFGLYGALLGYLLCRKHCVPRPILIALRNNALWVVSIAFLIGLSDIQIDNAAHLGGLVGGFCFGIYYTSLFIRR